MTTEKPNFDFLLAKLKHVDWRIKLLAFLEGEPTLTPDEIVSPHCCELGRWLDKEGLLKYRNCPKIQELNTIHTQLHHVSQYILSHYQNGLTSVEAEYETLQQLSQKLIEILEILEKEKPKLNSL